MIDRTNVAALIPSFREETRIAEVVKRSRQELDCVMVVDDGSPDQTSAEAEKAQAKVVRHAVNAGKGAAIKTGFRELLAGDCVYFLILDGDGQHLPEEIPLFIAEANRSGAQLIIGNRMNDTKTMPPLRKWTNRMLSSLVSRICRQFIPDTQCGFRMIHRDLVPHLFCETNAYEYESEMLFIAAQKGFRISSVPISTVYGEEKSKIHPVRDSIRFLKLMQRYA
jgi:glycosyltransferase involved in cell wall biosynthesis